MKGNQAVRDGNDSKTFLIDHVSGLNDSSPSIHNALTKEVHQTRKSWLCGEVMMNWPLRPELSISERTDRK